MGGFPRRTAGKFKAKKERNQRTPVSFSTESHGEREKRKTARVIDKRNSRRMKVLVVAVIVECQHRIGVIVIKKKFFLVGFTIDTKHYWMAAQYGFVGCSHAFFFSVIAAVEYSSN